MSVKEYALNFTQLAKYAPTMITNSKAKMNKFVSGVSKLVVKECRTIVLIKEMYISHLIHSQKIEEEKLKGKAIESNRATTDDGDFSYSRSDGHGCPQLQKKFSSQGSSNAPISKSNEDRVSNPKLQGGSVNGSSIPACSRCGKKHGGKYLAGMDDCSNCGKSGHKMKNCPVLGTKGRDDCRTRLVTFKVPNGPMMSWEGGNSMPKGQYVSCLKVRKMISEGCHYHLVQDFELYAKLRKCEFWLRSIAVLVHIVSGEGIQVDPMKIEVVKNLPRPLSPSDIRSFFGSTVYYRRSVEGFSSIASPFITLTQNKAKQDVDPVLVDLKNSVSEKVIEAFSGGGDGVLLYQGRLCVSNINELRNQILTEAHSSRYSIYPGAT
ncbi:hypothetical protein MTR67_018373 [Solanum verrucosum]|uniref:CCHC-type domain-containing protein n=1 Tax=Solanum verrucosum TaxID=315347 RepID=A0AAF0QKV7_SOLVR|nr:hypothetical protein MTR67_018373 [Solanum verrucosum]